MRHHDAGIVGGACQSVRIVKNVTARTAHTIPNRPPLNVAVGEQAQVGERDRQWPAFVFVTASHGTGWVPARYLANQSDGVTASVHTAYDTTELATHIGEVLEVLAEDRESGWLWCRSAAGQGWVPVSTLDES